MKKYIGIVIILILVIVVGVIVLNNNTKNVKIDINKLSEDVIQNVVFEDEMNEASSKTVSKIYGIDNAVSQKVYMSSGATAEEIAIFEFQNKNEVNEALNKVNNRIEEQKESFQNYVPKEIKKLNNPIIETRGNYLIVCITDDENAQEVINKYTK